MRRFALAQEALADAVMAPRSDFMDVFAKIREQLLSLLDAEHCLLSFEANNASVLEFSGRAIRPSERARREPLLGGCFASGHPVFLASDALCAGAGVGRSLQGVDARSYLCLPLTDEAGAVHGVAEVFNSRHEPKIITGWLRSSSSAPSAYPLHRYGSLHVFRQFIGKLIKAYLERAARGEAYVRITDKAPAKSPRSKRMLKRADSPSVFPPPMPSHKLGVPVTSIYPIDTLLEFLQEAVAAEACVVYAFDSESGLLWSRFTSEDEDDHLHTWWPSSVQIGTGVIGQVASRRKFVQFSRQVLSAISADTSSFSGAQSPAASSGTRLTKNKSSSSDSSTSSTATHGDDDDAESAQTHVDDVDDVEEDEQTATDGEVNDTICLPIYDYEHRVNGVVLLYKGDRVPIIEADIAVSTSICRHVGPAIHTAAQQEAILKAQDKAQTLLQLSAVVFRELETNSLLLAIMDAIKKPMQATKCSVFMMDDESNELYSPVGSDISCDLALDSTCRVPADSGLVGAAVKSGEIINVRDAYLDPRFNPAIDQKTGFLTRSVLAVPIKDVNGKVLGALEVVNKQPSRTPMSSLLCVSGKQYFDTDDEELARGIAYYIAIALTNARLFAEARAAKRRSDALLAMMQAISSANDGVGDVFKSIVDTTCQILHVEHGALFFVDTLTQSLICRVGSNWRGYTMPMGKYIQGIVAERGEIVNLGCASTHPDFNREYDEIVGITTNNLLCVPVKASASGKSANGAEVVAVFYAANKIGKSPRAQFCAEDIKVMRAICGELSSVIERRAWELVFETGSGEGYERATHSFLSQYTTTPMAQRRRSESVANSRISTPMHLLHIPSASEQHAHAMITATSFHDGCFYPSIETGRITSKGENAYSLIRTWELDPWEYSMPQLVDLVVDMFDYYDLMHHFDISKATMRRFVVGVKNQYRDVPYHNFYHAFTTLHVSFMIVSSQSSQLSPVSSLANLSLGAAPPPKVERALFEARDLMAIFVAAYCHDINHDGRTNDFHIRQRSDTAMLYNDQSVLENMHAAACFETMRKPGHDIFERATPSEFRHLRKSIIGAILSTDMHSHAAIVSQAHDRLKRETFCAEDETHRELLVNVIVHAADVSGPALSEKLHFRWSSQLMQEFNQQYSDEVALGLTPVTPFMSARPGSPEMAKLNLAFVNSCVFPLWHIMDEFLDGLEPCMANIQKNRAMWASMAEKKGMVEKKPKRRGRSGPVDAYRAPGGHESDDTACASPSR